MIRPPAAGRPTVLNHRTVARKLRETVKQGLAHPARLRRAFRLPATSRGRPAPRRVLPWLAVAQLTTVACAGNPASPTPHPASPEPESTRETLTPSPIVPVASPTPMRYIVQPGDTLSGIADRFGVDIAALSQANNLANPNDIAAGQRLIIPVQPVASPSPAGS